MESNPTTVRGWLETLPEPLKSDVTDREYYAFSEPCNCLEDAIIFQRDIYAQHFPEFAFWWGVWIFVKNGPNQGIRERLKEGYFAAQKAYEAQENRKPEVRDCCRCGSTLPDTEFEGFEQVCNDCLKSPAYQVKEVWEQVDPKELAELRSKAAKWDDLMATIKRLKIC